MNQKVFSYLIFSLSCLLMMITACQDDDLIPSSSYIPEGEAVMSIDVNFEPFAENVLTRGTLTPPGKGMDYLSDLCLLAYDENGDLLQMKEYEFPMEIQFLQEEVEDKKRIDQNTSDEKWKSAEKTTKCLKKKVKLPFGKYYLVAVANLGEYSSTKEGKEITTTTTLQALKNRGENAYNTLDALRSMKVEWSTGNYRNNREMLGYFTIGESSNNEVDYESSDRPNHASTFPLITVNKPNMTLHTWLRRCASKITIDFDGRGLRENVSIYIKDAKIYDIPKECTLGFGKEKDGENFGKYNNVAGEGGLVDNKEIPHFIEYGEGESKNEGYKKWPRITKGTPYILDDNKQKIDFHREESAALFFYENMQGDSPYGKLPVADLTNGGVINKDKDGNMISKDGVPYGTYIEVTGYYYSNANGNVSQGDIKYRFMIGKDVVKDCNAERNYHYKLTLKFRGNANDYDWHIDYKEEEGFDVPNPWYVSYLYNHDAMLPFKYTPPAGYTVTKVTARIIENPWYPSNGDIPKGDYAPAFSNEKNRRLGNGFLSLRATTDVVITPEMTNGTKFYKDNGTGDLNGYGQAGLDTINNAYFLGYADDVNRSVREYIFEGNANIVSNKREKYTYQRDGNKLTANIPLFTRAKVLVKETGYSGNNPYVGYTRTAKLELSVALKNDKTGVVTENYAKDTIDVIQVRRIVNPKGVYRSAGNNEDFHVRLLRLPDDNASSFVSFDSDGPWMAEIVGDQNFITLDGKQTVHGSTNTPIDFTIKFNKLNTADNKVVRNAVVRVRYHNYTCTHLIFVRQGYESQAISSTGKNKAGDNVTAVKWKTFNQIWRDVEAIDPRDEGSLFKFGTSGIAIDAVNNVYKENGNVICWAPSDFSSSGNGPLICRTSKTGTENKNWSDITSDWNNGFDSGDMEKTATMRDFEQLYLTPNIQFGYGVLYADGAKDTQYEVNDAYGYYRGDADSKGRSHKGMRGMFAYYWDLENPNDPCTAKNVFFPIGRSGYGHRKNAKEGNNNNKGILRYCAQRATTEGLFSNAAPFFCSLYHRPGAIYWTRTKENNFLQWDGRNGSGVAVGLDINYFSFDVNAITSQNVNLPEKITDKLEPRTKGDACFVRCVE